MFSWVYTSQELSFVTHGNFLFGTPFVAAAHFKGLVRPYTVPCDRPVKQDYPEGKDKQEQEQKQ